MIRICLTEQLFGAPKSLFTVQLYGMSEGAVWGIPTVGQGHTYFYALIFPVTRSFPLTSVTSVLVLLDITDYLLLR